MIEWLPIEIILDAHLPFIWPGLDPRATVKWMQFGRKRLSEPFFRQTVATLCEGEEPAWVMETNIRSVLREGHRTSNCLPVGFIFHMSRCGSTLISNALRAWNSLQVVSEAHPISRIFMPDHQSLNVAVKLDSDQERGRLAECIFNLFACYRTGSPEPIVVKFTSQNSLSLNIIRNLWPSVPCLFVIRNPIEVLISNVRNGAPPRFNESPSTAYAMCGLDVSCSAGNMSFVDFCARIIGRYLDTAIAAIDQNMKVIDYEDINVSNVSWIAQLFGLSGAIDLSHLNETFGRYSKDQTRLRPFRSDRDEKNRLATADLINAVAQWVTPQYKHLRNLSQCHWPQRVSPIM